MQKKVASSSSSWKRRLRAEAPLVLGMLTLAAFIAYGDAWLADPTRLAVRGLLFIWLLASISLCIFGVVRHADALAELLGEPLGTLVLTISVIVIEVSLIVSIMIEGVSDPTLARDTMFAVIMIMMNGMVGLCLLAGGLRHVQQEYNLEGARAYLAVLMPLSAVVLILPNLTRSTNDGSLSFWQAAFFSTATILLYAIFLGLQTMRHRGFFMEPGMEASDADAHAPETDARPRRRNIAVHAVLLFLTMVPVVGLAQYLAVVAEHGIHTLGVPTAVGGIIIAALILAPESISALEAAVANKLQRSINLCLGSALSTVALTVPLVLIIGMATGQSVTLGLKEDDTAVLILTLLVSMLTFSGARTNVLQGAVHLLLFFTYIVLIFNP
jgi:Ca2+:H+ antiporter